MLDLKDVFYFVQVVDRGGFTAAGNSLRVPKSTLSHRIQKLENSLEVRLINRTSRRLSLTDIGQEFYKRAVSIVKSVEFAEDIIRENLSEPNGVVRITTPVAIAQFALRDILPAFMTQYPKVRVVQLATDKMIDIVAEGFDLALRGHTGSLPDSALVQRKIADVPWFLFAGSNYLDRSGTPKSPVDLAMHSTMSVSREGSTSWRLQRPDLEDVVVPIEPRFSSNDMVALKQAACAGLGIVALPGYVCRSEVQSGELRQILKGWIVSHSMISALMPHRQGLLPAVRVFVDFVAAEFSKSAVFNLS